MKKLVFVSLALVGLALSGCSGDDGAAATNPNDAAQEFANPTGKLSADNKNDVGKAALNAEKSDGVSAIGALRKGTVNDFLNFSARTLNGQDFQACVSTSDQTSTIDWSCAAPLFENGCTGSGETRSTYNQDSQFTQVVYDGFHLNCENLDYSCDGTINYSTASGNTGYTCGELTCDINDINLQFSGCTNPEGHHLIRISGESFVIEEVVADGGCGTLTITVTDSAGSHTMTCDIATHESTCAGVDDVNTLGSCTIN